MLLGILFLLPMKAARLAVWLALIKTWPNGHRKHVVLQHHMGFTKCLVSPAKIVKVIDKKQKIHRRTKNTPPPLEK